MISFSLFPISLVLILPRRGNICLAQTRWYIRVHYYFFFRAYPSTLAGGSLRECFFLRFILIPSSFSHLRSFFLCLLGNLAVVMRRSVAGDTRSGEECAKRRRGKDEDTVPERDLDAIFKSSTTSILSLFSLGLSRCLCSSVQDPSRPRNAGYRNTALNRPRGLTLTWHHPLVQRRLPYSIRHAVDFWI